MPHELTRLTAKQLLELPRAKTVFFFPVGPLEDHGPHLPMGLDLHESQRMCTLAAERLEKELSGWVGVVMPPAPLGVDTDTTATAITVRAHVLRDWLIDACRSLKRSGFLHFVCFSGHMGPRQLTAIEEAGKMFTWWYRLLPFVRLFGGTKPTLVSACSGAVPAGAVREAPLWPDPVEHAGRKDTSIALAIIPERVDPSFRSLPPKPRVSSFFGRALSRWKRNISGYWGKPSEATAEEGNRILTGTLDDIFPKLRAVWEGADPNHIFRSWYSVLPPNKSFFKIWVLFFFLLLSLWLWVYWNIEGMLGV